MIDESEEARKLILEDFAGYMNAHKEHGWALGDITSGDILGFVNQPHPLSGRRPGMRLFWKRVLCLKEFFEYLKHKGFLLRNPVMDEVENQEKERR